MKTKRIVALLAALAITTAGTVALAQHHEAPTTAAAPGEHGEPAAPHEGGEPAEHAEHGEGHHGPAPINWTDLSDKSRPAFIGLFINFAILVALYYAMGKKGVVEGLKKRREDIGKHIESARERLAEAKERAKKYQADLKNAEVDAATAKASLITAGKGEVEHMLAEAELKADRMKHDADRLVDQERKQTQQDLLNETIERAVERAQRILETQATAEDHARLAQDLLAELARKPSAPRVSNSIRPPASIRPGGVS